MGSHPRCWVVSYARARDGRPLDGRPLDPSREGLLVVASDGSVTTLHRHPDGARLAHGPVTRGTSPGSVVRCGEYACELLMLAPHGGGGNPAYAAAFVRPGETIPSATRDGDGSWLEWFLDEESDEGKFELRAPPLPHPDDPQPREPIPFEYYPVGAPRYAPARRAAESRETSRAVAESYDGERARETVPAVAVSARAPARAPEVQRPLAAPPASAPAAAPRAPRASVFEEEFLDDESFAREVRFDDGAALMETANKVVAPSSGGTLDEMDSLRKQLAELERLTGVSADDAERVLNEDLSRNSEVSSAKVISDTVVESPKRSSSEAATSAKTVVSPPPPPPTTTSVELPSESVSVRHEAVVEVPPTVSVSANIFKANDVGVAAKTAVAERTMIVPTESERPSEPPSQEPVACAPVVRASPKKVKPLAPAPVPSVVAVTPHEVETNDAWAAAVARRNRSVDEDSSDEDDLEDVKKPTKIVQNIAKQPNRVHLDGKPDIGPRESVVSPRASRVEAKVVASPSTSPSVVSPGIASRAAAFEKPRVATSTAEAEGEYRTGSVAQRASLFGEQASFRKR